MQRGGAKTKQGKERREFKGSREGGRRASLSALQKRGDSGEEGLPQRTVSSADLDSTLKRKDTYI